MEFQPLIASTVQAVDGFHVADEFVQVTVFWQPRDYAQHATVAAFDFHWQCAEINADRWQFVECGGASAGAFVLAYAFKLIKPCNTRRGYGY